jgi:hypothetical protein
MFQLLSEIKLTGQNRFFEPSRRRYPPQHNLSQLLQATSCAAAIMGAVLARRLPTATRVAANLGEHDWLGSEFGFHFRI